MYSSEAKSSGHLSAKLIKGGVKAPLSWKMRNVLRINFLWNFFWFYVARLFTKVSGVICLTGRLKARLIRADGSYVDYGVVAHGLVTTAWVNFVVDNLQTETAEFGDLKFHDSGVGTTGPTIGDTDMETTDGEARVAGTQTENGANVYQTVGTITYTTTKAITEHGVFTIVTGGTMVDRHTFTAINVVNTDQIEFTYEYTATAGG